MWEWQSSATCKQHKVGNIHLKYKRASVAVLSNYQRARVCVFVHWQCGSWKRTTRIYTSHTLSSLYVYIQYLYKTYGKHMLRQQIYAYTVYGEHPFLTTPLPIRAKSLVYILFGIRTTVHLPTPPYIYVWYIYEYIVQLLSLIYVHKFMPIWWSVCVFALHSEIYTYSIPM